MTEVTRKTLNLGGSWFQRVRVCDPHGRKQAGGKHGAGEVDESLHLIHEHEAYIIYMIDISVNR